MAKKITQLDINYNDPETLSVLSKLFLKINPKISLEDSVKAHKVLFSDPTKPPTEEEILNYFNK